MAVECGRFRCVMAAAGERPLNEVQFLTVAEVASVMRVSKMTVYRLVHPLDYDLSARTGRLAPRRSYGPMAPKHRVMRSERG